MLEFIDRITQKQLADRLQIDTTNMMVICDSLEKRINKKRTGYYRPAG
jgi:hypothetical protein